MAQAEAHDPTGRRSRPFGVLATVPDLGSTRRLLLWGAFALVHVLLIAVNLSDPGLSLPDVVVVYRMWAESGLIGGYWLAVDGPWVYPIVAMAPMLASLALGPALQAHVWFAMVTALNAVALWRITAPGRASAPAWWWVAFLALLGPIAITRVDAITVPLAMLAMLEIRRLPVLAGVLLTLGAWIKIWPAALLLAAVAALRERGRLLLAGAGTSVAVVGAGLILGSGWNVFSFLGLQGSRGLQIEAPAATPLMWWAAITGRGEVRYDQEMLTFQVTAPGTGVLSAVLTPALGIAAAIVLALGARAVARGADRWSVLATLSLALVAAMLVFNKVGSPQLASWLAVPLVLWLSVFGWRASALPVWSGLVIAGLTQLVYPFLYSRLLALDPAVLALLTARNVLYLALLAWSGSVLVRLARTEAMAPAGIQAGMVR